MTTLTQVRLPIPAADMNGESTLPLLYDTTLPKEALKDTDKTVVATNGTKVDVYKINTYRNWEAGVGIGKLNGKTYIPVAIQRNYDRCHSVELQANLDTAGHVNGGQVMWKVHF